MKALKVIGLIFGGLIALLAIAGGVFYVGWLKAPSQQEVCENVVPILLAETTSKLSGMPEELRQTTISAAKPELEKSCMESTSAPEFGKLPYVAQMKCLKAAKSVDDIKACDEARKSYRR